MRRHYPNILLVVAIIAGAQSVRAQDQPVPGTQQPVYSSPQYPPPSQPQYPPPSQPQYPPPSQPQYPPPSQPQYPPQGLPYNAAPGAQSNAQPGMQTQMQMQPGMQMQYNVGPGMQYGQPPGMPYGMQPGMQPGMQMPPGMPMQPTPPVAPVDSITSAIQALTQHIDSIIKVTSMLPNGTVNVGAIVAGAEALTASLGTDPCMALSGLGVPVTREQYDMLKQVETIAKDGPHIAMEKKTIETFPLGITVEGGIVDDIRVDGDVEFDIVPLSQNVLMLSNVRGIAVEARDSQYLRKHTAKLTDITLGRDSAGQTILDAKLTNPEKWWERMVTGHHNSRVGVTIRIGTNGQVQILSQ